MKTLTAEQIPTINKLRNEGKSYGQIAKTLNQQGFRSPTGLKLKHSMINNLLYREGKKKPDTKAVVKSVMDDVKWKPVTIEPQVFTGLKAMVEKKEQDADNDIEAVKNILNLKQSALRRMALIKALVG